MRFVYSFLWKGLFSIPKRLMIVGGLLAIPLTIRTENRPAGIDPPAVKQPEPPRIDPRTVRLKKFLLKLHCPVSNLAEVFVQAADENRLDWRLLPSISVIESGGGKAYRNNNILGWNQGLQSFPSISSGIYEVASRLGKSSLYRNRDVLGKLRLYNPNESYAGAVLTVMRRISPTPAVSAF
jgi:hypothetical protein